MEKTQPTKRSIKLQLMLAAEELAAIDDWRYLHRKASRAEAVRELIAAGLATTDTGPTRR